HRTRRPRGPRPAAGHGDHDDLADRGLIPPGPDAPWATAPCPRGDPRVDWTSQPGGVHVAGTGVPALEGLRPDGRTAQRAVARRLDAPFAVVGPAPRPFAAVLLLPARRCPRRSAAGPSPGDDDGGQPEGEHRARPTCVHRG